MPLSAAVTDSRAAACKPADPRAVTAAAAADNEESGKSGSRLALQRTFPGIPLDDLDLGRRLMRAQNLSPRLSALNRIQPDNRRPLQTFGVPLLHAAGRGRNGQFAVQLQLERSDGIWPAGNL